MKNTNRTTATILAFVRAKKPCGSSVASVVSSLVASVVSIVSSFSSGSSSDESLSSSSTITIGGTTVSFAVVVSRTTVVVVVVVTVVFSLGEVFFSIMTISVILATDSCVVVSTGSSTGSVSFTCRVSVVFIITITGATVVVAVELTESGIKPRAITSVVLLAIVVVVRACVDDTGKDVVGGIVVAELGVVEGVVVVVIVVVVVAVVVVVVEVLEVVEVVVVITVDVVVVEVFVAGIEFVTGSVTFITAGTISAIGFSLLVLMLVEDAFVVEVDNVEVILVDDGDALVDVVEVTFSPS